MTEKSYMTTWGSSYFFIRWVPVRLQKKLGKKHLCRYIGQDVKKAERRRTELLRASDALFKAMM